MTDSSLAVVVLAAGEGTRMKSALAKVLHPIAGIPMIGHVLSTAAALQPKHTVAVVRHQRDQVAAAIAELTDGVTVVDQDDVPGTGRAVELALDALSGFDGDVVVVSGDVPLLDADTLGQLISAHRANKRAASVLSAVLEDATGYGRIVRDDGSFTRIVEHKDATDEERALTEVNSGTYVFSAGPLRDALAKVTTANAQGEKYLTDVIELLVKGDHTVDAQPVAFSWLVAGVNDRAQLSDIAARLNAMIVRGWQMNGVTIDDPATTWIDRAVSIAADAHILPGTFLHGATTIAAGATVGPHSTLRDCEVGEGASLNRVDATLAVISAGASVGPFSYLRPGTELGPNGKIGAFVETKNAKIGAGSKVPHLSYIGDTTVGEESNIGAGTITANYDGVNKHHTVVGSHVRTGSHNVFVAPVTIADGVYTAAGTVVRKDIPAGALGMSVAPQRNLAGWVEEHRPGTAAADAASRAPKE
ncbi:MAG: bifunctional UDP-N-acetylglucosamine diphosphorylase/glucosamine-phosphate N-acetyltransferase [Actinomycetota bacterium]|jgi:bifunctional UDP-N-acetylglucosamine pyrophosphorylase/glucosamine-1-phosphate N-acetyltransferase